MPVYKTPDNLVELLNGVVRSASRTAFYRPRLSGATGIATLDEFRAIPPTPLAELPRPRTGATLLPSRTTSIGSWARDGRTVSREGGDG